MSSYDSEILLKSADKWERQYKLLFTPVIEDYFRDLWKHNVQILRSTHSNTRSKEFYEELSVKFREWLGKVEHMSLLDLQCEVQYLRDSYPDLEGLIFTLLKGRVAELSIYRNTEDNEIMLKEISVEKFVHQIYRMVAKRLQEKTYLFFQYDRFETNEKNLAEFRNIIHETLSDSLTQFINLMSLTKVQQSSEKNKFIIRNTQLSQFDHFPPRESIKKKSPIPPAEPVEKKTATKKISAQKKISPEEEVTGNIAPRKKTDNRKLSSHREDTDEEEEELPVKKETAKKSTPPKISKTSPLPKKTTSPVPTKKTTPPKNKTSSALTKKKSVTMSLETPHISNEPILLPSSKKTLLEFIARETGTPLPPVPENSLSLNLDKKSTHEPHKSPLPVAESQIDFENPFE